MNCSARFSSLSDTDDLLDVEVLQRAHFVGVEQLLQHQAVLGRPHLHHVLLAFPGPLGERAALALAHRLHQQRVRLAAALVGREEVGLVVEDRIDRLLGDEGDDVDGVAGAFLQRLELVGR